MSELNYGLLASSVLGFGLFPFSAGLAEASDLAVMIGKPNLIPVLRQLWFAAVTDETYDRYLKSFDEFERFFRSVRGYWPEPKPFSHIDIMFSVKLAERYPREYSTAIGSFSHIKFVMREYNFDVEKLKPRQRPKDMPVFTRMCAGYRKLKPKIPDLREAFLLCGAPHPEWDSFSQLEKYLSSLIVVVYHGAFRPEVLTRWEPKHTELLLRSGAHISLNSLSFEEFELYVDCDEYCRKFCGLLITIRTKWRPKGQIFLPNLPKLRGTPFWWFDPVRRFRSILSFRYGFGGDAWKDRLIVKQSCLEGNQLLNRMTSWSESTSGRMTQNSFRSGWRSGATLASIPEPVIKLVGRWKPTHVSEDYFRLTKSQLLDKVVAKWNKYFGV